MAESFVATPSWLESLLSETFFNPCTNLQECQEKDVFCVDCCNIICTRCVHRHNPLHRRQIQILKYRSKYAVPLSDIRNLMDCKKIQSYRVKGMKAFFLRAKEAGWDDSNPHGLQKCPICHCLVYPPFDYLTTAQSIARFIVVSEVPRDSKDWPMCPLLDWSGRSEGRGLFQLGISYYIR